MDLNYIGYDPVTKPESVFPREREVDLNSQGALRGSVEYRLPS